MADVEFVLLNTRNRWFVDKKTWSRCSRREDRDECKYVNYFFKYICKALMLPTSKTCLFFLFLISLCLPHVWMKNINSKIVFTIYTFVWKSVRLFFCLYFCLSVSSFFNQSVCQFVCVVLYVRLSVWLTYMNIMFWF